MRNAECGGRSVGSLGIGNDLGIGGHGNFGVKFLSLKCFEVL